MFAFIRKNWLNIALATLVIGGITASFVIVVVGKSSQSTAQAHATGQTTITDCSQLPVSPTTSFTISHEGNFDKKGHTYLNINTYTDGIPTGYTLWSLLRQGNRCYMHSFASMTPATPPYNNLSNGDSIGQMDTSGITSSNTNSLYYEVIIAGPADSKSLMQYGATGTPTADKLIPAFGHDTFKVNRDKISVETQPGG